MLEAGNNPCFFLGCIRGAPDLLPLISLGAPHGSLQAWVGLGFCPQPIVTGRDRDGTPRSCGQLSKTFIYQLEGVGVRSHLAFLALARDV